MSESGPAVVIGVDIGTTSTKSVAFTVAGAAVAEHSVGYSLDEPHPGFAEQDPHAILDAVRTTVSAVAAQCTGRVRGLSFSSAMHSLIGLDEDGSPLTASITWADSRASTQAERLRASTVGLPLHRRTGTPIHPMSPLTKLIWFHEQEPALCLRVAHWVGIKEYVTSQLVGGLVMDHSMASGTGLMDIHTLAWDGEAMRLAGITVEQLPALVATTHVLPALTPDAAGSLGVPVQTPLVVGAGDGPLANLGSGAVRPGVVSCTIGTSGAMRVMVEQAGVDPLGGVFCYALTESRWAVGGAINNGGLVLNWAADALTPDLASESGEDPYAALLALAAGVPPGCGGLIMLPYLQSERAPHWSSLPRGVYVGLTREHRREHLVRAALEGVCQQLATVLSSVRAAGNEVREIRATGGFARSPLWRQMLADVLGLDVGFPAGHEGSSFGAALLGMQALGLIGSIDIAADLIQINEVVHPDPSAATVYAQLRPVFVGLYDALVPAFTSLRRLAPGLPAAFGGTDSYMTSLPPKVGPVDRPALDVGALRDGLVGDFVVALEVVEQTASTNADLAVAARDGAPEGTVLVAEFQQAGRGRFTRTWTSPPRAGVTFSTLLRPTAVPVARWGWLPLLAGVALTQAVRSLLPVGARVALKWPNDLLLGPDGAKAAGILAEAGPDWIVLGMGVNVDNGADELPNAQAGSLRLAFPAHPVSRDDLLIAVVSAFAPLYRRWVAAGGDPDASGLRAVYEQACATLGRHVEVQRPDASVFGVAEGIDATGALVVLVDGARVVVSAGDVAHVRAVDR